MTQSALITGITGQDGVYLARRLVNQGYAVHGVVRCASNSDSPALESLPRAVQLHQADLLDELSLVRVLQEVQPDEIYHLAAQSYIPTAWAQPVLTGEYTAMGTARILEAIRLVDSSIRFYQASSSEMFGQVDTEPQNEQTPFRPTNPYGAAKLYAHWLCVQYRQRHRLFACSGILYNHESPLRSRDFVSRKITDAVARIKMGLQLDLRLGNLDSRRDWGYAEDYVESMWLMLQQSEPDDYVIATGVQHTVRELAEAAFAYADLDYRDYVVHDPELMRPAEVNRHRGDYRKAEAQLGWEPRTSFEEMVAMMVDADIKRVERELAEINYTIRVPGV